MTAVPGRRHDQREDAARALAGLVARLGLSGQAALRLTALLEILTEDPHAPTTVRAPLNAVRHHLADSLVALELPEVRRARRVADLGSGPGVPGLPLAIALADAEVALVESNGRKCEFLRRACGVCGATNAEVVQARAEDWPDWIGRCDLAVARALAPLSVVAEYAAPLLCMGGALVVWRGRRDPEEEARAGRAAGELGLEVLDPVPVAPYPDALHRHLHVMVKRSATPSRFPRRPGVARKRPLGAGRPRSV